MANEHETQGDEERDGAAREDDRRVLPFLDEEKMMNQVRSAPPSGSR